METKKTTKSHADFIRKIRQEYASAQIKELQDNLALILNGMDNAIIEDDHDQHRMKLTNQQNVSEPKSNKKNKMAQNSTSPKPTQTQKVPESEKKAATWQIEKLDKPQEPEFKQTQTESKDILSLEEVQNIVTNQVKNYNIFIYRVFFLNLFNVYI